MSTLKTENVEKLEFKIWNKQLRKNTDTDLSLQAREFTCNISLHQSQVPGHGQVHLKISWKNKIQKEFKTRRNSPCMIFKAKRHIFLDWAPSSSPGSSNSPRQKSSSSPTKHMWQNLRILFKMQKRGPPLVFAILYAFCVFRISICVCGLYMCSVSVDMCSVCV